MSYQVAKLLSVSLLAFSAVAANAQSSGVPAIYTEVGYTAVKLSEDGVDANPGMLRAIVGANISPYLAVEGMLAFGLQKDHIKVPITVYGSTYQVDADVQVQNAYGVFVRPQFNITPEFQFFGRLGWVHSKVKTKASYMGYSATNSTSDSDLAYGLGAAYQFSQRVGMSLDYMRYYNKDGSTADGLTAAVRINF